MLLLGAILLAIFVIPWPWGLFVVIAGGMLDIAESLVLMRWSRRRRPATGAEALIGQRAIVVTPCHPLGQVRIAGELWAARSEAGADLGDEVAVRGAEGLTLLVD
jgi:membrane protein implicated in regulation of membrane protease activity